MLRFKHINFEKYKFVEGNIRGGTSIICKSHTKANNKFFISYDSYISTSYIIYLDANNLYRYSIMQLLPTDILDWINL